MTDAPDDPSREWPKDAGGNLLCRTCGYPIRSDGPHNCPATGVGVTLRDVLDGPSAAALARLRLAAREAQRCPAEALTPEERVARKDAARTRNLARWHLWTRRNVDGEDVDPGQPWMAE